MDNAQKTGCRRSYSRYRTQVIFQGEKLAKEMNAVFLETSAKDNICVNDLFEVGLVFGVFFSVHFLEDFKNN